MRAPNVRSSTSGTITSSAGPAATTRPLQGDEVGQVGRHAVEVVGGEDDREPVAVEVVEQVEHLVAGADVDAGRSARRAAAGPAPQQRPRQEHALLLPAGQLPDVAGASSPMPSRRGPGRPRPSRGVAHGSRRRVGRDIRTHSATVTGKFQSTVSSCGTYDTGDAGLAHDRAVLRAPGAEQQAQQRGLAAARRADDAGERAACTPG
jgi:hypothetical protein